MGISKDHFTDCIGGKHGKKTRKLTKACSDKFPCPGTTPGGSAHALARYLYFCSGTNKKLCWDRHGHLVWTRPKSHESINYSANNITTSVFSSTKYLQSINRSSYTNTDTDWKVSHVVLCIRNQIFTLNAIIRNIIHCIKTSYQILTCLTRLFSFHF